MGEGLSDYQFRQFIERMKGLDKRLKDINETLERQLEKNRKPVPPEDPYGYTE